MNTQTLCNFSQNISAHQWWIQDFSDGGANPTVGKIQPIIWQNLVENYMKMKEIGLKGDPAHPRNRQHTKLSFKIFTEGKC